MTRLLLLFSLGLIALALSHKLILKQIFGWNPISEIRKKYFNFFGAHERACVRGHALARVQDKPVRFVTAKYLFQRVCCRHKNEFTYR